MKKVNFLTVFLICSVSFELSLSPQDVMAQPPKQKKHTNFTKTEPCDNCDGCWAVTVENNRVFTFDEEVKLSKKDDESCSFTLTRDDQHNIIIRIKQIKKGAKLITTDDYIVLTKIPPDTGLRKEGEKTKSKTP